MNIQKHLKLYLIADFSYGLEKIEEAIQAGVTIVQLREKNISSKEYLERAVCLKKLTTQYAIPLIINDRVDIALLAGADGVHLGQSDLPINEVRKHVGKDFIIGATAKAVSTAVLAEQNGANYIGSGAWFKTSTKLDTTKLSPDTYRDIRNAITIPSVGIGGINTSNCHLPLQHGVDGIALSKGILGSNDITREVESLLEIWEQ